MISSANKEMLDLFKAMEGENIPYFLLSNFEELGNIESKNDIDIFVGDFQKEIFLKILNEKGWLKRREEPSLPFHNFYYKITPDILISLDVKFYLRFGQDVDFSWALKNEAALINNRVKNTAGVYRPKGLLLILISLIRMLKEKSSLEEKYLKRLDDYLKLYESEEEEKGKFAKIGALIRQKEWQKILDEYFERLSLKKIFKKPKKRFGLGYTVIFLGTDGSGKTTAIKNIKEKVDFKFSELFLGENKWAVPLIGKIYQKRKLPFLNYLTLYFLYPLDLFLRVLRIYRGGKERIILIDRIPGFPLLANKILAAIYKFVIPKPDLAILLTGSPQTIWERKKENSLSDTERDILKWDKVISLLSGKKYIIDTTNKSIQEVTDIAIHEFLSDDNFRGKLLDPIEKNEK